MIKIDSVFVYGTLKRGECRESFWSAKPHCIRNAWVRGALYGRADYPAMVSGDRIVQGELWSFSQQLIEEVIETLDRIEGTNQSNEPNLYHRVFCQAFFDEQLGGESIQAYTYHYAADPKVDGFRELKVGRWDSKDWL